MTDRQTDKPSKVSVWWSVTAFSDSEIAALEDSSKYPPYIKRVEGGREQCPETGKVHFQGAIQLTKGQRMSFLKKWLQTSHLEPAKKVEALRSYAMKEETAIGPKVARSNDMPYQRMSDMLTLLGETAFKIWGSRFDNYQELVLYMTVDPNPDRDAPEHARYRTIIYQLVTQDVRYSNYHNNALRQAWEQLHPIFIKNAWESLYSITRDSSDIEELPDLESDPE